MHEGHENEETEELPLNLLLVEEDDGKFALQFVYNTISHNSFCLIEKQDPWEKLHKIKFDPLAPSDKH